MASKHKPVVQPSQTTPEPKPEPIVQKMFFIRRDSHITSTAFEVTVVDGVVVETKPLRPQVDIPAHTIGAVNREMWKQFRNE